MTPREGLIYTSFGIFPMTPEEVETIGVLRQDAQHPVELWALEMFLTEAIEKRMAVCERVFGGLSRSEDSA